MAFTDKQMFDAIENNENVKDCFKKITDACKELKSNTDCPDADVDRFLEFTIGKWQQLNWENLLFINFMTEYIRYAFYTK